MNIYLAGPMRAHADLNYPAFNAAASELRKQGHFVFSPPETIPFDTDIRRAMAIDTAWICTYADAVALLPGWESSAGATAEQALAKAIGIKVILL
ncbi:MAG: DUF4406 domain-containing protein [Mesorhizobium sp.]|nr:MAG: DUF4406 domain-containing protein [Mesorhizobium sp.]